MKIIKEPLQSCNPQIKLDEYRRLVFLHAPALAHLLDQLDAGIIPEPLQVMTAISQSVAYFTNGESVQGFHQGLVETRSAGLCSAC